MKQKLKELELGKEKGEQIEREEGRKEVGKV